MSDTLHFAFEYLDRGWPVVPVVGKTPAVPWLDYQQQRPTCANVKSWFASNREYNLAVVTGGVSELVVIDCDSPDDAGWWRESFPQTPLVVQSGGGGIHLYYRYPAEAKIRNRIRVLDRSIDVRADGGLVVAPPSVHPDTGARYTWQPWDHYALDEIPKFDPSWLRPVCSPSAPSGHVRQTNPIIRDGMAYIRYIEAVSGHGGHNATFRAACKLRDAGLSADQALDALRAWNKTNAEPPWTEKELAHKIHDAYR